MKGAEREKTKGYRNRYFVSHRLVMKNCFGSTIYLVVCGSLFSKSQNSRHRDSQVVSTDVVDLGLLNKSPDMGLLKVLNLVFVGSSKVGDHATVVASDDNTTFSGGLDLVDAVFSVDTGLFAGLFKDVGVLVFADAANVHDGVFGEHVLLKIKVSMSGFGID
jgi:hypothetical protein